MKNQTKSTIILFLAAIIWGCGFVAQEMADGIGPFTLNAIRYLIGALLVLPLAIIRKRQYKIKTSPKRIIMAGAICGLFLALGSGLQQYGITLNAAVDSGSSGKAGFITALYIVLVPAINVIANKRFSPVIAIGVATAVLGLYFISVKDGFTITRGDFFLFLNALAFSAQIIAVGYFARKVENLMLSAVQFFAASFGSFICMLIFESPTLGILSHNLFPILYLGIMSSGVAFTLQTIGQKYSEDDAVASLVMSFESLFALISASIYYQVLPTPREAIGCFLMMVSIIIVQRPWEMILRHKKKSDS